MSSKQIEVQKEMLFKSYTAIENIANIGQLYCCCQIFSCCETIQNFLRSIKRYCCYCQFADRYNRQYLNEIKKKHTAFETYYNDILGDSEVLKINKDVNTFVSDCNIFDPFSCTTNLNEEQLNQLKDFLFDL